MIRRTYQCNDCDWIFEVECESGNDPDPPCPNCDKVLEWIPVRLNINTHKSKAVDLTQKIIEEDYGLSNLNDGNREGDVAYKADAPMQTNERENIEQQVREYVAQTTRNVPVPAANLPAQARAADAGMNFWGGGPVGPAISSQPISTQLALQAAKQGPGADVNPMELLHQGIKSGHLTNKARIIARWRP